MIILYFYRAIESARSMPFSLRITAYDIYRRVCQGEPTKKRKLSDENYTRREWKVIFYLGVDREVSRAYTC